MQLGRTKLIVLLAALVPAGVAFWWVVQPPAPPDVPITGLQPDVAQAIGEARSAIAANPRSAGAWGTLGQVLLANAVHPEFSAICFAEAERLDAENPRWPYLASGVLLEAGLTDAGLRKLERATDLADRADPENHAPRLLLAETLQSLGQVEAAEQHFRQVVTADPSNVRAHFYLGTLASARGEWRAARTHLEKCLGAPDARQKACIHLAAVCARLDDRENANFYAKLAARLPKDTPWADPYVAEYAHLHKQKRDRYVAIERLEAQGQFAQAAAILERLVRDNPEDYLPQLMSGRVLAQMGEYRTAHERLDRACRLAPEKVQVHYLLGLLYFREAESMELGKDADPQAVRALFAQAAKCSREALRLNPDYGFAHMCLGIALKRLGNRAEAVTELRAAVHCNPEYPDNHLFLGEMLAEDGDLDQARRYLDQALRLAAPNDARPRAALDRFYSKPGAKMPQ